jgi:hypothetical protein
VEWASPEVWASLVSSGVVGVVNAVYGTTSFEGAPDGAFPQAGLIFDNTGALYGTTYQGGASNGRHGVQGDAVTGKKSLRRLKRKRLVMDSGAAIPGTAIHEVGGAPMDDDPRKSVLNRFNQCWDADNVFVTDDMPWKIISIGARDWAYRSHESPHF